MGYYVSFKKIIQGEYQEEYYDVEFNYNIGFEIPASSKRFMLYNKLTLKNPSKKNDELTVEELYERNYNAYNNIGDDIGEVTLDCIGIQKYFKMPKVYEFLDPIYNYHKLYENRTNCDKIILVFRRDIGCVFETKDREDIRVIETDMRVLSNFIHIIGSTNIVNYKDTDVSSNIDEKYHHVFKNTPKGMPSLFGFEHDYGCFNMTQVDKNIVELYTPYVKRDYKKGWLAELEAWDNHTFLSYF